MLREFSRMLALTSPLNAFKGHTSDARLRQVRGFIENNEVIQIGEVPSSAAALPCTRVEVASCGGNGQIIDRCRTG